MTGYGGAVRRQSSRRRLQVGGTILTVDLESGPNPNFIEVGVQISRVAVNAIGARIHQLILAESSGKQAHPQCASALSCKQVPNTVTHDHTILQISSELPGSGQEYIRVRLGALHIIS